MKVSLLIANYNNGKYFQDCYNSIIAQTYGNWEAVIIDDKSTDDSVEIIKKIIGSDERFRLIELPENKGVGVVKHELIMLAQGEICAYVDPDDTIAPNALAGHIKILQKNKDVVLTYSRLVKCDEQLKKLNSFKAAQQVPNGEQFFFNFPVQIAPLVCFRKEVYSRCAPMNPEFRIAEDQDLYLKFYEKGKVAFINQEDYFYRGHPGGISQNQNKEKSYNFWAKAIYSAMKRRNLKSINGVPVPDEYPGSEKIFEMLEYQNKIPYRIKKKVKIFWQKITG